MANTPRLEINQTHSIQRSKTSSILPDVRVKYPRWLDELFFRLAMIYEGKWTHSIQDPQMLEWKKAEWYDSLQEFNDEIIKETIKDVKKLSAENRESYPDLCQFYAIAKTKARARKEAEEMEKRARERSERKIPISSIQSEQAAQARAEIRRICKIKSIKPNGAALRQDNGKF